VKTCPNCFGSYDDVVGFCPRDGAALRSSTGLEPGTVIRKKYEILSEIGRGGMGVVYRARHLIWNEEKALKVVVAAGAAQQGLKGLMAEALVMRQLQHPHIVRVEDADYTEDDQPFVVMEYVDGQSLGQKLKREGPLAPELALQIAAQTCSALSAAHQKGIVHRDIKPANLLLAKNADGSETVKIIDFGIAKVREEAGLGFTGMMTGTTGFFVGTPGYASPEQALGIRGSDLDGRTDLYSLGLVLYEMLTGRLPFAGDNSMALLVQRIQVPPVPLDQVRPGLSFPPDVSNLVMKALAKDRENRYRSAEEMERAILAVLDRWRAEHERDEGEPTRRTAERAEREPQEQETIAVASRAYRKGATTVLGRRESSRRWPINVIAAGGLVLVGLGFFVARSLTERAAQDVREQKPQESSAQQSGTGANPTAKAVAPPRIDTRAETAGPAGTATAPLSSRAGMTKVNPKDGLRYVWIPPGTFTMGCSAADSECYANEKPAHKVTITKGFWLGQTEVTQAAYQRVVGTNPSYFKGASLPVEEVGWDEAQAYCQAVGGRLPTEAEWENAARAGSGWSRYGDIEHIAWYSSNIGGHTQEVAQKEANAWGLYDMLGNVWEWTADWYGEYARDSAVDPAGPTSGQSRALRGGSWKNDPRNVRVSGRTGYGPSYRSGGIGLRCVGE
jgi:serine/threonine-protein kinase